MFENLLERVMDQFKAAIVEGRGLDPKAVESFADGRIMTGEEAVELGLADKLGSFNDAVKAVGMMTGLGSAPELFTPQKDNFFTRYLGADVDSKSLFPAIFSQLVKIYELAGKPLYMMPSYMHAL